MQISGSNQTSFLEKTLLNFYKCSKIITNPNYAEHKIHKSLVITNVILNSIRLFIGSSATTLNFVVNC